MSDQTSANPLPPKGMYRDPIDPSGFRLWEGTQWADGINAPPPSMSPSPPSKGEDANPFPSGEKTDDKSGGFGLSTFAVILALISAVLIVVGFFKADTVMHQAAYWALAAAFGALAATFAAFGSSAHTKDSHEKIMKALGKDEDEVKQSNQQ